MAATTAPRKSVSIYDYPEHLNPFHEEDNHTKIRFWTLGRRLNRSNSITFSGLKDIKNSWAFRSFMKKGKKGQQAPVEKANGQQNGETSPIMYRRSVQYSTASRSTLASPEKPDRYVYGGSITPLPRSRFQERLRSTSHHEVNSLSVTPRMARSDVSGSRLSVESTNPFEEDGPIPPVRASRRKKKRAPLPPQGASVSPDTTLDTSADTTLDTSVNTTLDTSVNTTLDTSANITLNITDESIADSTTDDTTNNNTSALQIIETEQKKINITKEKELELDDMNLNIELKIVEDEDGSQINNAALTAASSPTHGHLVVGTVQKLDSDDQSHIRSQPNGSTSKDTEEQLSNSSSEDDVTFPKVDIVKYRRNSSVNEDDIRLRRGNLEDFHPLFNKRSKSLNNGFDTAYTTYDINLNETMQVDTNSNEEPQKVVCKLYENKPRKPSIETISSTEKEFIEIDKATRELEREITKLNSALHEDDLPDTGKRLSVSEIKKRFDKRNSSPNPIPKPRRSHYGGSNTP